MRYKIFLYGLIISSLAFPLFYLQVSRQQLLRRKAIEVLPTPAPREAEQTPISEWVPIDVHEFNTQTDKRVQELNLEISLIKKQRLSLQAQTKKLDPLERELNIQQINKEEHNLMDENKDEKIDYAEFNKRDVILANKIYKLRHTTITDLSDGLYDEQQTRITSENRNNYSSSTTNLYRVFVEAGIYQDILPSLQQYKTDVINDWNYQVQFYLCNNCTKEEIKDLLRVQGIIGTVFVGNLPIAWYGPCDNSDNPGYFPIDFYFMDLNGLWGGETNCNPDDRVVNCFTSHDGETKPEIFFGRLTTPEEVREIELINNYFSKNHQYRTGINLLKHQSLNFFDYESEEWIEIAKNDAAKIAYTYPQYKLIFYPQTTSDNYKNEFYTNYEHLAIFAHSTPLGHFFDENDQLTWEEIKTGKPHFHFYNLIACSVARFTTENYIAGWYVFQESNYGLAAIGSTRPGGMLPYEGFYLPLKIQNHFGSAFKTWWANDEWTIFNKCNYGGLTLIGDPTLKVILPNENIYPCPRPEKPQVIAGANVTETPGQIFLKAKDRSPNALCQRKGYLSVWQNGVKIPGFGSGWMNLEQDGTFSWTTPYLSPGSYEWRANLQNKDGQSCEEPLKAPFTVTATSFCGRPIAPEVEEGPRPGETIIQGQTLNLKIRDVSTQFGCHPLDVVFSIWPVGSATPVRSSRWQENVLTQNSQVFLWEFSTNDLVPGHYEWRANLKNTAEQTCERPLIIPFSIITETPAPTPTPRQYCCCLVECGAECWLETTCSGRQKVRCDLSYCQ